MDIDRFLGENMSISGIEDNPLYGKYPCRLPVWWGYHGEIRIHPSIAGISGRNVIMRIQKRFNKLEKIMAKILRAPKEIRRPLDQKNSMLWQLADGSRTFEEICSILDSLYHEDIAPVIHRTAAGINLLKSKNLLTVLDDKFTGKWNISPGETPPNQQLEELDEKLGLILQEE